MKKSLLNRLKTEVPGLNFFKEASWKKFSILGIGSNSDIVVTPEDDLALQEFLNFTFANDINLRVIGAGGNILGSDKPFDGILLRLNSPTFSRVVASHTHTTVGGACLLRDFLIYCANCGLGGVAGLAGIPASIGGAVRMNAGAHGLEIKDIIEEVFGFYPDGTPWCADVNDLVWEYRFVNIPDDIILTGIICKLIKVDVEQELRKIKSELNWRKIHFPSGRSTGCVFKNPTKELSAGKLIDDAGCKNHRIGGAVISDVHANYFLNDLDATEKDYLKLLKYAKRRVYTKTSIILKPEITFLNKKSEEALLNSIKPLNILVLKGGDSHERSISLQSGAEVEQALISAGHNVRGYDIQHLDDFEKIPLDIDVDIIFPVLHGGFGENGEIQKIFEEKGIKFIGCGSESCRLAMDKIASKQIMFENSLPSAAYVVINKDNRTFPDHLNLPLVVKPPLEGSTVGISIVKSKADWNTALDLAFKYDERVLVEEFIDGVEIAIGVLNGKPLPVVEIHYPGQIFDYDAKYEHKHGHTEYLCPSKNIDEQSLKKAQEIALAFAKLLNVRHLTRIDLIVDKSGIPYILEANNMPGFTSSSLLPKAAKSAGISFTVLCATLATLVNKDKSL